MKDKQTTTFGRDYFLEALPVEWDEKLDGPRPSQSAKYNQKKKGDVQVSASELDVLKSLGLIK